MSQVTVYIRSEDMDKWRSIEKKSEFIHNALNTEQKENKKNPFMPPFGKNLETEFKPAPPGPNGYLCCEQAKPCKHWHFDGNHQVWVNEITNREREV